MLVNKGRMHSQISNIPILKASAPDWLWLAAPHIYFLMSLVHMIENPLTIQIYDNPVQGWFLANQINGLYCI